MNVNKKKALIVAGNDLNNSGVPGVIYKIIVLLSRQYDFDILIFGNDTYYYERLLNEGITNVRVFKINEKKPKSLIGRFFWRLFTRPIKHYYYALRLMQGNNYNIIHSFKEYESWPFFKAGKKMNINKRIFHNNIDYSRIKNIPSKILMRFFLPKTIKCSTILLSVSKKSGLSAFKNKNFSVLYNSYNEAIYNNKIKNTLNTDQLIITQVGSFSSIKNQLFTLEVFKCLQKFFPDSLLRLIGNEKEPGYIDGINTYILSNKLTNKVNIICGVDNVSKYYANTTYSIIPSLSESFCLVAIESQACGIKSFASSNIPSEVNCGGLVFLDLSIGAEKWAEIIKDDFILNKNKRNRYDMRKFSNKRYLKHLKILYLD